MIEFIDIIIKIIYFVMIFHISKNDFKNKKIDKNVIVFGSIISIIYMVYQVTFNTSRIYINTIYLIIYILLFATDTYILRKYAKESYITSLLTMLNIMIIFAGINIFIKTIMVAVTAIIIYLIIRRITKRKNIQEKEKTLSIGFFVGASNLLTILVDLIIKNI